MNADRVIQMILRSVVRRLVGKGVNAGIDYAGRRGKPREELTPEERKHLKSTKEAARRAKQARRIIRKIR